MGSKIMIVDDSAVFRKQVDRTLVAAGFQVLHAANGQEGLDTLERDPSVALVLCDMNMPVMGGIEFLRGLRNTASSEVPVVILTTESQPEVVERAKLLGARAWLRKPCPAEVLLNLASKVAHGR